MAEAEISFLELMIRHHEGGVVMAQAVLEETNHAAVERLATAILAAQQSEIEYMERLLAQRGVAADLSQRAFEKSLLPQRRFFNAWNRLPEVTEDFSNTLSEVSSPNEAKNYLVRFAACHRLCLPAGCCVSGASLS